MKDGVVLFYCKDGVLYPVALTEEQNSMLQLTAKIFEPLQVVNIPQGPAINLTDKREGK